MKNQYKKLTIISRIINIWFVFASPAFIASAIVSCGDVQTIIYYCIAAVAFILFCIIAFMLRNNESDVRGR